MNSRPQKKVLLLAYYFPPRVGIGSLRAAYLAKYLPIYGWNPTVVTARVGAGSQSGRPSVVETDYTDVREWLRGLLRIPKGVSTHEHLKIAPPTIAKSLSPVQRLIIAASETVNFPDTHRGWLRPALTAASKLLRSEAFDAIITTSYPYSVHITGRRLAREFGLPWIADLRDAWRGYHYNLAPNPLVLWLHARLEHETLRRADAITTVSEPLRALIQGNNPTVPTFTVPNAFDPDEWSQIPFVTPQKMIVTYAGSLGHHRPEPLFQALAELFKDRKIAREDVSLVFYGHEDYWLKDAIRRYELSDVVETRGYADRQVVLAAERATTANLLLLWDDPRETGMYTGKFFEYLGAGRPILAVGGPPNSVVKDVLDKTGGWYARSQSEIQAALLALDAIRKAGRDPRLLGEANQFSAQSLAAKFAAILDEVVAHGSGRTA